MSQLRLVVLSVVVLGVVALASVFGRADGSPVPSNSHQYPRHYVKLSKYNSKREQTQPSGPPIYLLISTSSKLYSMRIPEPTAAGAAASPPLPSSRSNSAGAAAYEVIYEEKTQANNWITDAFYVKSENLIYVNVYNSTSASSDIFTLRYDAGKGQWVKGMLYEDQAYCLGIAYNEERRELYWTAAKSIMSGSSKPEETRNLKALFNLDLAKKLLYLRYDHLTEILYVSTLNQIYACSVKPTESSLPCKIILRDLLSARGLYLDAYHRYLYVVDHKKRVIKRTRLLASTDELHSLGEDLSAATILSTDMAHDLGDLFYMTVFSRPHTTSLIWSEFSGKIKMSPLNDTTHSRVIFSTNEYTYSVNVMDNSTHAGYYKTTQTSTWTTTTPSTTTITTTTTTEAPTTTSTDEETTTTEDVTTSQSAPAEVDAPQMGELVASANTADVIPPQENEPVGENNQASETVEQPAPAAGSPRTQDNNNNDENDDDDDDADDLTATAVVESPAAKPADHPPAVAAAAEHAAVPAAETAPSNNNEAESVKHNNEETAAASAHTTTPSTTEEETTTEANTALKFVQKIDSGAESAAAAASASDDETSELEASASAPGGQVQNLRALKSSSHNSNNNDSSSSSTYNLIRSQASPSSAPTAASSSSSYLNMALYVIICLLCFSLVMNIVLLYVSRMRMSREKLIITHEICDATSSSNSNNKAVSSPTSQRGHHHSDELTECNVNLIQHGSSHSGASSSHSGHSALDLDH